MPDAGQLPPPLPPPPQQQQEAREQLLDALQQAVACDAGGGGRARLVEAALGAALASPAWRPALPELLAGLEEALERRREEVRAAAVVGAEEAALRWQAAAYRQLAAAVVALARDQLAPVPAPQGGGGAAGLRPQLLRLTAQLARMLVRSCAGVRAAQDTVSSGAACSVGGAAEPGASSSAGGLRSEGEVRLFLRSTPFNAGNLRALWGILAAWGAPGIFTSAPELLYPLWAVFASVTELCSGGAAPTAVDCVLLQELARSLAPAAGSAASGAAPAGDALRALREFVLSELVGRALRASASSAAGLQRAGVNALRLVGCLLEDPSMRASPALPLPELLASPAAAAVRLLLRAWADVLWPPTGATASLGVKETLYELAAQLLRCCPWLLPPPAPGAVAGLPPDAAALQGALRAWWLAVARDVLRSVEGPVAEGLPDPQARAGYASQRAAVFAACANPARAALLVPLGALQPLDEAGASAAKNALWRPASQATAGMDAFVERHRAALQALLRGGGGGGACGSALGGTGGQQQQQQQQQQLFRPGSFKWALVERGIALLDAMLEAAQAATGPGGGSNAGLVWAHACLPSLAAAALQSREAGKKGELQRPFKRLVERLAQALGGEQRLAVPGLRLSKRRPPPPNVRVAGAPAAVSSGHTTHQEQLQPNAARSAQQQQQAAVKQEPASQAAAAGPVGGLERQRPVVSAGDVDLANLASLPRGSLVSVTGLCRSGLHVREVGGRQG